jgi:hypothetical protein
LIGKIIYWFATSNDLGIKEATSYAIANTVEKSNNKQIKLLVDEGCIECLCEMLNPDIGDTGKILMAIKKVQKNISRLQQKNPKFDRKINI